MNDPHVKALHYRVVYAGSVGYDKAEPLYEDTAEFTVVVDGKCAIFKMKEHYTTLKDASKRVEEYIRAWEMLAGLEHDPGDFRLVFERPKIVARSPLTGRSARTCGRSCGSSSNAFSGSTTTRRTNRRR
jgi:hypothetical protein